MSFQSEYDGNSYDCVTNDILIMLLSKICLSTSNINWRSADIDASFKSTFENVMFL